MSYGATHISYADIWARSEFGNIWRGGPKEMSDNAVLDMQATFRRLRSEFRYGPRVQPFHRNRMVVCWLLCREVRRRRLNARRPGSRFGGERVPA